MQVVEDQTLILYHTELRGQWPQSAALAFAARLPYARRLAARRDHPDVRASLAGIALALRALTHLRGRAVQAAELVFAERQKPRLAAVAADCAGAQALRIQPAFAADFSISHSGSLVGCAAMRHAHVGFDIETGTAERIADWVVREALMKGTGEGLRAVRAVRALAVAGASVCWRGALWYLTRLDCFHGAAACIATSMPVAALEVRAVTLEELFPS
jgi:hypothetical protein